MVGKIIFRKIIFSLLVSALSLPVLASGAQPRSNVFRDRQGRFAVGVPQGWQATALDENTVQIAAPPAYVTILALQTTASAQEICSQLAGQLQSQWQGLELVREDQPTVAGQPAYAVVFTGTNPRGEPSALRIIGISVGNRGFALMFSVPMDQLSSLEPAFVSIEQSFSVGQRGIAPGAGPIAPGPRAVPPAQQPPSQGVAQAPTGGIPAFPLQGGFCSAVAPAGWKVTGVLPDGKGFSIGNGTFSGAYTIEAFTAVFIQGRRPYCADPRACVQQKVEEASQALGQGPIQQMSQVQQYGEMFVQDFENAYTHTTAMYSVYPMSTGGYVLIFRTARGPKELWPSLGVIAVLASGSIRCQAQYRPTPGTDLGRRGSASESSTYNRQLGTEYAHDPETGETFFMRHATDWMENGPDGPGYYRQVGGGYRKLTPGLSP
ncbi:MAG: DUF1795 domain-containing protein [Acidobacteriia bacterium]|nr:DUF1795 domain-containing protein [Terriglobia bacterium]